MIFNTQKFKKEINALASLRGQQLLHPLKREQLKLKIFSRLDEAIETTPVVVLQKTRVYFWRYAFSILTGLALFGGSAVASSNSLPGDMLYPVKLAKERIEFSLAFTAEGEAKVETKHAEKRLEELGKIRFQTNELPEEPDEQTGVNVQIQNTATTSAASSSTVSTEVKQTKTARVKRKAEIKAETAAQIQIEKAIAALTKVQTKLEEKGNASAAAQIGTNIQNLQNQAESQNIKLEARGEVRGASKNNDESKKDGSQDNDGSSAEKKKIEIQNRVDGILKVD